jgi:hypothetical protein
MPASCLDCPWSPHAHCPACLCPPAQVSLVVAKVANVGLGLASVMFPGVPQIPEGVLAAADDMVGTLARKSSAEEFACVQDELDRGPTGTTSQKQVGQHS